jgi:hypothetical protein
MRLQKKILSSTTAAVAALVLCLQASSALAVAGAGDPCALISKGRLVSILGISHIEEHSTIGSHYPTETDGRVESDCFVEAWRGAKPTRSKKAEEGIANGTGAEFSIQTFATDSGAPEEDQQAWVGTGKGYDTQLALEKDDPRFLLGILNYPHGLKGTLFSPPRLGSEYSEGFQNALPANGLPRRIRSASAYWTDGSSHSILSMGLIEGTHAAVVRKRLDNLAKVVVPAFGI